MKLYNNDLFDDIDMPVGLDKTLLINTIYDVCGLCIPIYPEHDLLKSKIETFFGRNKYNFDQIASALTVEYDPIYNYDRYEEYDEERTTAFSEQNNDTNSVNTYDSDTFHDREKNANTRSNDGTEGYKTNNHIYGNIGVTTSQQMLESEINLRTKYNIYEIIAKMFAKEFTLGIIEQEVLK